MVAEVTYLYEARPERCPHTYLQMGLDEDLTCVECGTEVDIDDPLGPCPDCHLLPDNPAHEYGCERGRKENN